MRDHRPWMVALSQPGDPQINRPKPWFSWHKRAAATSESSGLVPKYFVEPVEHHAMLQAEVVELPVEGSIFGCECV